MDVQPAFVVAIAAVSVAAAVFISYWLIKTDPRALSPKKKPPALSIDAQQLLHDLTRNGAAVVKIEVVDPSGIMLRSPRTP